MAPQTKQYEFRGHNLESLVRRTDPAVTIDADAALYFDVTWDNAVADEAAVDAALALYGALPAVASLFSAEALGGGLLAELVALAGDPANARLNWVVIGPDNVVQLFNSNGNLYLSAEGVGGATGELRADADGPVRINSTEDVARVIGQDVEITAQAGGGFPGRITIDAVEEVQLSGDKVRIVDGLEVLVPIPLDPGALVLEQGLIWFRSDLEVPRYSPDGVLVRTLAPRTYLPESFQQQDVPAAQAATALFGGVTQLFDDFQVMRDGSLAGLNLRFTAALAAGTATAVVTVNGVATALTVVVAVAASSGRATSDYGVIALAAGDLVGVTLATSAGFLPSGSLDVEATVQVWEE